MTYIDAHCHLADSRLDLCRDQVVTRSLAAGISIWVQGGVGPEDWAKQKELKKTHSGMVLCFGLHPYWVADHDLSACEIALDQLAKELSLANALGETGLDFRAAFLDCQGQQIELFERQLELAQFANKPVVLHLVRAHPEALKIISLRGLPQAGGMVHSFNGSFLQAQDFIELGLKISVGGPLCRLDNRRLRQAVKEIPLECLLLESDSPDQPPPGIEKDHNEPATLLQVAAQVAELKKIPANEVLDRTSLNARKLFQI